MFRQLKIRLGMQSLFHWLRKGFHGKNSRGVNPLRAEMMDNHPPAPALIPGKSIRE